MRRETAFSPESAAGSSEAGSYRRPFCASSRRGANLRWGFGASYYRAAGDRQAFPTREEVHKYCNWTVLEIMSGGLSFS